MGFFVLFFCFLIRVCDFVLLVLRIWFFDIGSLRVRCNVVCVGLICYLVVDCRVDGVVCWCFWGFLCFCLGALCWVLVMGWFLVGGLVSEVE